MGNKNQVFKKLAYKMQLLFNYITQSKIPNGMWYKGVTQR